MVGKPGISIVGIGASAGGVQALQKFFELLPADTGAAYVVIVHLDPSARSELPAILAARSRMRVQQVTRPESLARNCVYVIPPDRRLQISDDQISAAPFEEPHGQRAPVDLFFRSLAEHHGDGFGIIMTGAGSDGAAGVKSIKEHGGIVLVQSPDEAEYPAMPRSAIATQAADFVLPIRELVDRLVRLLRTKPQVDGRSLDGEDERIRRILLHVRARTGHDFAQYKRSTLQRRILRRMQVTQKIDLDAYYAYLCENGEEVQALFSDLLLSVTTFFRDPEAFEALARQAIAPIFESRPPDGRIRAWVAGCATGEEAYSVAILLLEEASRRKIHPEIQVFASDMDARALAIAREGRYPVAVEADVSEDRLRRYFTRDGEFYRVRRELRDVVLFASHNVLRDPPFSRLDLITCSNLLIYLDRELQRQVLATMAYGLNPGGFLFLGVSETAELSDGLFKVVDRDGRLYRSTGRPVERLPALTRGLNPSEEPAPRRPGTLPMTSRAAQAAHRKALEALAPPSILVDQSHRVLHLSENAGRYLQRPSGILSHEVVDLVRPELRVELRAALQRVFDRDETSLSGGIPVRFNGTPARVHLQVRPVDSPGGDGPRRALILFIEGAHDHRSEAEVVAEDALSPGPGTDHFRRELEMSQTRLRTQREESDATTEELRAANEELHSINEEYRSTAEELETSREELQSINEELQTVNAELKLKLESVSRANSDLRNLMVATDLATLFLDTSLRIKRFTPRLADLVNITTADLGRPITDFTHQLEYDGLEADIRRVLTELAPVEREIRGRDGRWFMVRYRPYRTMEDKIDGVVVTFLDVTDRRRMEDELRERERDLRQESRLVELSRSPIFVWDFDDGVIQWNRGSEELYGYSKQEMLGRHKEEVLHTEVPNSSFQALKEALLRDGTWTGEVHHTTKDGRRLTVESRLQLNTEGHRRVVLESTHDITQRMAWASRQRLLRNELTHRVKNTLMAIQSIVQLTWRRSTSPEQFIERLNGRIGALAQAHNLLSETEWQGADLRSLIVGQTDGYAGKIPSRLHLHGEAVLLPPHVATPFGMVLHELAINAAKYGALSGDKGTVDLSWQVDNEGGARILTAIWQEQNGPPVQKPPAEGFGSRLIREGLPRAAVEHEFRPEGVRCTIKVGIDPAPGETAI